LITVIRKQWILLWLKKINVPASEEDLDVNASGSGPLGGGGGGGGGGGLLLLSGLLGSVDAAVTVAVEEEGAPIPVPACGGLVGGGRGAAPGRVGE